MLFCVVCFSSFFLCIIFSCQMANPGKPNPKLKWKHQKTYFVSRRKKRGIEIFDWWLSEFLCLLSITLLLFQFGFLNWWKSLPYFLLNFYGNRYSTGNTNLSNHNHWSLLDPGAIGLYWTAMFLLLGERKFPFTLRHSKNILTKLQCICTLWCKPAHSEWGQLGELTSLLLWTKLQVACFNNFTEVCSHLVMGFLFMVACSAAFNRRQTTNIVFIICFGW